MNKIINGLLSASTLAAVLGPCSQAALAQTEASSEAAAIGLEEIVVTAQRRSELLQDVPIAVTALSGSELSAAGIATTQDLTIAVPSLNFARSTYSGQPTIRGVGTRNTGNGDEANVATYIDGVYQSKAFALFSDLADISSVQVLKGPQGTLFGRNATGGAVVISTRDPEAGSALEADVSFGKYGYRRGHLYANHGLTDRIAFNLSAVGIKDDGYTRHLVRGGRTGEQASYLVRGKMRFDIADLTALTLMASYGRDRNDAFVSNNAYRGNNSIRTASPEQVLAGPEPYTTASDVEPTNLVHSKQFSYRLTHDFAAASLSATGSYQTASLEFLSDADRSMLSGPEIATEFDDKAWSQELILTSNSSGPWQWVTGVYAFKSNNFTPYVAVLPTAQLLTSRVKAEAYSVFGEATYNFTDQLSFTAGARYSDETRKFAAQQTRPTAVQSKSDVNYDDVSPRAILRYEFTPEHNVYASFSRGFKSGVFNGNSATPIPVDPEQLDAYEIGTKNQLFDGRAMLNIALFYYDYSDLQVQTVNENATALLMNAAKSEIKGIDADFNVRVTRDFSLRGGFSILDAKYNDFPRGQIYTPIVLPSGELAGNRSSFGDVSGNKMIRTPDYSFNLGGNYEQDVLNGRLVVTGQVFFTDKFYFDVQNRVHQPSYTLVNASASWHAPSDRWWVGVYGENLADEVRYGSITSTARGDAASYMRPRSYGVRFGVSL